MQIVLYPESPSCILGTGNFPKACARGVKESIWAILKRGVIIYPSWDENFYLAVTKEEDGDKFVLYAPTYVNLLKLWKFRAEEGYLSLVWSGEREGYIRIYEEDFKKALASYPKEVKVI